MEKTPIPVIYTLESKSLNHMLGKINPLTVYSISFFIILILQIDKTN